MVSYLWFSYENVGDMSQSLSGLIWWVQEADQACPTDVGNLNVVLYWMPFVHKHNVCGLAAAIQFELNTACFLRTGTLKEIKLGFYHFQVA